MLTRTLTSLIPRRDFLQATAAILALALLPGCGSELSKRRGAGRDAEEQAMPRRVVSLSPSVTAIIYGVGAFDRVVAVSDYCDFPPQVKDLPRPGGWLNASLEHLAALRPDLVVMTESQARFGDDSLHRIGLRTLVVRGRSLEDALAAILDIGSALGKEDQAQELAARTRAALEEVRRKTFGLSRPRVLCVVDRMPGTLRDLYSATQGSFLAELVEIAGGSLIAPEAPAGYSQITKEAVALLDPEVIIDMVQGSKGRLGEDPAAVWKGLETVSAVRGKRIHPIYDTSVLHPSQFVADTARRFAAIIHPEVFAHDAPR